MRTIKFRGQRSGDKKWVYGSLVEIRNSEGVETFGIKDTCYNINNGRIDLIPHEVIPETVGQYTGLTDKNDKEIYEGDIVKDEIEHIVCFGEYEQDGFDHIGLYLKHICSQLKGCFSSADAQFLTVVGNIHSNPELLNQ